MIHRCARIDLALEGRRALFWVGFALLLIGAVVLGRRSRKKPVVAPVVQERPRATTDSAIYLSNLDGQITELERLVAETPSNTANVLRLGGMHHLRGRYRGDLDEIQLGIDTLGKCLAVEPQNANCLLARAEQEQSLHRFASARADIEHARKAGADPNRANDLVADLDWNDGRYDDAIAAIRRARKERPSSGTWMREAQLDHDLGEDEASDREFDRAERAISDTAPLPYCHLDVQRGIQKRDRGQLEAASTFFKASADRMPTYIAANEHLAETLAERGKTDEAIAIYEKVVAQSDDPEFPHALATLYAKKGRTKEAADLEAKAKSGYERLISKYPEAMYWHASEMYLDIGENERAYELLVKNLVLRPNSASHVALARAALATNRSDEARTEIDKALAMPVRSAVLFTTAAKVYPEKAADYLAQAKKLNPLL